MDPSEQLGGAVNDLRGWLEARLKVARRAVSRGLLARVSFPALRLPETPPQRPSPEPAPAILPPVVLVATGELSDEITLRLIHRSGGRQARIRILAGFELDFAAAARRHTRQFERFGATDVLVAAVTTRVQAEDEVRASTFRDADLLVLAADDAHHAALMLAGSAVERAIREVAGRGGVVALLGAAVGLAGSCVPVHQAASWPDGLDLLEGWVCDAAHARRGRVSDFMRVLCRAPAGPERALWLEPGAAVFFDAAGLEAWGEGSAWCADVPEVRATLAGALSAVRPAGAVGAVPVTLVPPGYRLDPRGLTSVPVEEGPARIRRAH